VGSGPAAKNKLSTRPILPQEIYKRPQGRGDVTARIVEEGPGGFLPPIGKHFNERYRRGTGFYSLKIRGQSI